MARIFLNQNQTFVSDADDIITSLGNLSDVSITSEANGDILVYNSGTGNWTNQSNSELTSLNALSDVSITSAENGQILFYNGSTNEWENTGALFVSPSSDIIFATVPFLGVSVDGQNAELYVENNSDTPTAGDGCGSFRGYGKNDATDYVAYSSIETSMDDVTEGSELGSMNFQIAINGSLESKININSNQVKISDATATVENTTGYPQVYLKNADPAIANDDYLGAITFNKGDDPFVSISSIMQDTTLGSESSSLGFVNFSNGGVKRPIFLNGQLDEIELQANYVSQYHEDSFGARMYLINSIDPGVSGDVSGAFNFGGYSDAGAYTNYVTLETYMDDTTDGAEIGSMEIRVIENGTNVKAIEFRGDAVLLEAVPLIANEIKVNSSVYNSFSVVRPGSGTYAANIASDINANLDDGDRSSFIGFEIQTNTDFAYPGLIGTEYNATGVNNGNKILLQVYDDGVSSFTRNTILEAAEERVVAYRPFKLAGYASTALPTGSAGDMIAISDDGYKPAYFDGTDWRYVSDDTTV